MTTVFTAIQSGHEIDLSQHAVIEASAGTGKTYTMVELVMRLLCDATKALPLEKILMVTFTENAAAELKSRVREKIQQSIRLKTFNNQQHSAGTLLRLEQAFQHIESASIFTIHGFCQRIGQEYAFESADVLSKEVVNDSAVIDHQIQALLRQLPAQTEWKAQFEKHLSVNTKNSITKLKKLLTDLARTISPDFDVVKPSGHEQIVTKVATLIAELPALNLTELEAGFMQLQGTAEATLKKRWVSHLAPFIETLLDKQSTEDIVRRVLADLTKADLKKDFFKYLNSSIKIFSDFRDANREAQPALFKLLDALNEIYLLICSTQSAFEYEIVHSLLPLIGKRVQSHLKEQGLVTFDSMIRSVYEQLQSENGSSDQMLTRTLRDRYEVAMIDEFQDTDPYQWHIFKYLFLQNATEYRRYLWVIGDPKQSIYGFRGAEVATYLLARGEMFAMGAKGYRLHTNYRTIAPLIAAYNNFFTAVTEDSDSGFWYQPEEIVVAAVAATAENNLPQLVKDNSGLTSFTVLPLDPEDKAAQRKNHLAEQMAETIKNRLRHRLEFKRRGQTQLIDYNDICILVRSHSQGDVIKTVFKDHGIPVSFQKKNKLYQSDEAIHYEVVFSALAFPHDNARLHNALRSLFFNLSGQQTAAFFAEQLPSAVAAWTQLSEAAADGDWTAVFDWLLETSGTLFRAVKAKDYRRIANLKQISFTVCQQALQENMDIHALLRFYKKLRLTAATKTDADIQNQDTEQAAVKVLTMHSAKGLEFPVVFLYDALSTPSNRDPYNKYFDKGLAATVYQLDKEADKSLHLKAQTAAFKQLYYVAMTRAIFKLFVPYIDSQSKGISADFKELIAANLETCMAANSAADEAIMRIDAAPTSGASLKTEKAATKTIVPFEQSPAKLSGRSQFLHSFSSLSAFRSPTDEKQFGDTDLKPNDEPTTAAVLSWDNALIPGGITTGHVLHGIFEHIDFQKAIGHEDPASLWTDAELMTVVDQQMQQFKMSNRAVISRNPEYVAAADYRQQLAAWVWHTLKKPIAAINNQCLGDVGSQDRRHEMAFHWQQQGRRLTGYIDLLFRLSGDDGFDDYYILDWKSNFNAAGYAPDVLAETVMKEHHYDWQYQLYAMAVHDWLKNLGLKKARLRGVLYLFSRGVDCHSDVQDGLFFRSFDDLDKLREATQDQLIRITEGG